MNKVSDICLYFYRKQQLTLSQQNELNKQLIPNILFC